MDLGELMESRAFSEAGLAIARQIGDPVLTGFHLCGVATAFRWAGELDRAQEAAEGALAVADTAGNPNLLAWAHNLVATMPGIDDLDSARAHYASALRLFERAGNFSQIASTYVNLGNTEMIAGNLEVARLNFEAALEGPTTPYQRSVTLSNLGTVCLLEGDATAAEPHCREALRLSVRMGHWLDIRYPLLGLAVCASEFGDLERAALLHGAADSMVAAQGAPFDPAEAGLRDRDVSALRAKMGAAAFERSYARGQEMRRVDALDFAFE
jgi:tetratricopeptide (TPR) repeat protein